MRNGQLLSLVPQLRNCDVPNSPVEEQSAINPINSDVSFFPVEEQFAVNPGSSVEERPVTTVSLFPQFRNSDVPNSPGEEQLAVNLGFFSKERPATIPSSSVEEQFFL